jgi:histidinol-phosphate aminotransferase
MGAETPPATTRLPLPNPALGAIERLREGGREREGLIGLDRNERLAPLPQEIVDEIRGRISEDLLTTYPSLDELYDRLALATGQARDRLLLTAGSDAAVKALYQVYAKPGTRAVMLDPSYAMYPIYAEMFGAAPVRVPFAADLTLDGGALLEAVGPGVELVFLANPNQPTGTMLPDDLLAALLERALGAGALVVVDEAYYPFSEHTLLPRAAGHPNLVLTRTFSKAWGLAGVRAGLVAAHPEVIRNLYKVRSAYDVNAVAATCVSVMLDHPEVAEDYAREVAAGRAVLTERALALGLEPVPSRTNFLVIRLGADRDPAALVAALQERGYLVKGPFGAP